jgi:hypothetical protein
VVGNFDGADVDDAELPVLAPVELRAVDGVAPAGITNVSPGWMTLVRCSEFARSNADKRTPWRHAMPARLSPSRTVIVVSLVVAAVVRADRAPSGGAADATPPKIGSATVSATAVGRRMRAVRFTDGPSTHQPSTFTSS